MQSFTSVPFKSSKHQGLTEVNGVAKFSSAGIVLEFDSKILGLVSVGLNEARISIGDILDIKFKKGVFKRGAKIEIRTKSLAALAGLPADDGKLVLKLTADDFERGRDAVEKLQKDIAGYTQSLPPAHTPVSVLFDASEDDTEELK
ncbi:MAG TPA: hypothetical protein PLL77_07290 [Pyrinomonadaceae bacterium]|nr:hypothetical protein [Pyrinomonadaceae bacterium]